MSTTTHMPTRLVTGALSGAAAGIGGGIVFGALMAMTGMLTMIAGLVGASGPVIGLVVHLVISAGIGAGFGVLAPHARLWRLFGYGLLYGLAWWVLGPLVLMPAMLGMPILQLGATALPSLIGHLLYGAVTALVLYGIRHRTAH
ncbi:hypothetical protein SAMN04487819_10453 [Actinopolyspora alba]|uniref:Uncharacterized protein n=1 Tax=Actinopolyspora alba TaxID=673379 RepID=A0A1I1VPF9_9ACTN|nr:hypothetical protein [Actinopolyspora alba]SFD84699.1 hypothetical protein SAMN04487819_10453 [Actinopolyspora alba]